MAGIDFRKNIKLSIVIPVYNSHKIVKRQILYFYRLHLPEDVEIFLIDDGSDPPHKDMPYGDGLRNLTILPTGNKKMWTQTAAKNLGVKVADGEYIFITDIDHILTFEAIQAARNFTGDKMSFPRQWGIINRQGRISQVPEELFAYGLPLERYRRRGLHVHLHTNTYVMKKSIFVEMGGYPPVFAEMGKHDIYDDNYLYGRYRRHVKEGKAKPTEWGPPVLTFPNSLDKGWFHDLGGR